VARDDQDMLDTTQREATRNKFDFGIGIFLVVTHQMAVWTL